MSAAPLAVAPSASVFPVSAKPALSALFLPLTSFTIAGPSFRAPNREAWLTRAVELLRVIFANANHPLPAQIRVSCGFSSERATSRRRRALSETWWPHETADGRHACFLSPCLSDPRDVLLWLIHELLHIAADTPKHDRHFGTVHHAIGLAGTKSAPQLGPELLARLAPILEDLGPYPHAAIDPSRRAHHPHSGQFIKLTCAACGYLLWSVQKWLSRAVPPCPYCADKMICDGRSGSPHATPPPQSAPPAIHGDIACFEHL